jgi:nitroimidazol reductase NimA-like FMN-containing flavoprotein (pyridoxamine 5'-phosphate oxidase superfamily)
MYHEIAKHILSEICYITVATVDQAGLPWISPLYASFDERFHFYWISSPLSLHSHNIRENPQVAFAIYDSTVPEGTGRGVYIQATAHELIEDQEIAYGLTCLSTRVGEEVLPISEVRGDSPLRLYEAKVLAAWINSEETIQGKVVPSRIKIDIHAHKHL